MKTLKEKLIELDACRPALEWAADKTWREVFETCHRGDWLLWLFVRSNPNDLQKLTLAKGHCAATVLHLMKDERSKDAVRVAIAFGEGKATRIKLDAAYAADAADAAAYAAADAAAYAAAYAAAAYAAAADADAYAAADAADAAAYAAYAAAYAAAADAAYAAAADAADAAAYARKQNQIATADICRKYLPFEIWNITNELI